VNQLRLPDVPKNPDRGRLKPVQAARLVRLAIDRRASLKDRTWALETLLEAKGRMSHEDLAKMARTLTGKGVRLRADVRRSLLDN